MGMFDTILLDPPLACPRCGATVSDLQTKDFGQLMETYRLGSLVRGSPVLTGIVKDTLWCDKCPREVEQPSTPIFLAIWHSILVAVGLQLDAVERKLASIDRVDLIGWLDDAQRQAMQWQQRFYALRHDVQKWHDHLQAQDAPPAEDDKRRRSLMSLWKLPEEILAAPDPLAALLERHLPDAEGQPGLGWD